MKNFERKKKKDNEEKELSTNKEVTRYLITDKNGD